VDQRSLFAVDCATGQRNPMETAAAALSAPKVEPRACAELDVSPLFVSGCVGNVALARQKWEKARQWRQRFDIDKVENPRADGTFVTDASET
jgi:hypothetical protein